MKISKTNKKCLRFLEMLKYAEYLDTKIEDTKQLYSKGNLEWADNSECWKPLGKNEKIIRITEKILEASELINFDTIKNNISNLNIEDCVIFLHNDAHGIIRVKKKSSDIMFLCALHLDSYNPAIYVDSFNFTSKSFFNSQNHNGSTQCLSEQTLKIIVYLFYGEIKNRFIPKKKEIKLNSYSRVINDTEFNISYADTLWKQRINTEGFKVRGHFRLQPCGKERKENKLIWIEEFSKNGYNRKSTRELTYPKIKNK